MNSATIKQTARERLGGKWTQGKWATFAVLSFVVLVLTGIIGTLTGKLPPAYSSITSIIEIGVVNVIMYACSIDGLRVVRDEDISVEDIKLGFVDYARVALHSLLKTIFLALWTLLLVVPGVIMGCAYSMSELILYDNPGMSSFEAIKASRAMMRGHKMDFFLLVLSFIGWFLLGVITLGIALIWVLPHFYTAVAAFYENLKSVRDDGNFTFDSFDAEA